MILLYYKSNEYLILWKNLGNMKILNLLLICGFSFVLILTILQKTYALVVKF